MSQREPIFNVPSVVLGLLAAFFAVHLLRWVLPAEENEWLTAALAFIPARLSGVGADLPGGRIAIPTSFVTHQFVHGDLAHLLLNSAWLLAFGTPVARRTPFGSWSSSSSPAPLAPSSTWPSMARSQCWSWGPRAPSPD